jgi:hypothetical protein
VSRLDRGIASPETRGGRLSLKTWRPRDCSELAGGERFQDSHETDDAQRWGNALWHARNAWDVQRRHIPADAKGWLRGGGLGDRRLDKREANRLWDAAKAAFAKGGF